MTTELVNSKPTQMAKPATLKGWLNSVEFKDAVAQALPKHLTPDRFIRAALTAMTRIPKLADCTQASFLSAMLTLSQMGLEPDGRRAHLIPFGKECQLIVDYKGLAELVMRSGIVSYLHADIVCENDEFEFDIGEIKRHKIDFRKPRGAPYAVYALCKFRDGTAKADVMTITEVERIRSRSRAGNAGPWKTDWNEMAKKTVFRRMSKWLPLSAEIREVVEADDDQFETVALPALPMPAGETKSDQLAAMLDQSIAQQSETSGEESQVDPAADPVAEHDQADRMDLLGDLLRVCTSVEEVNEIRDDHLAGAPTDVMKNAIGMACSNRAAEIGAKTAGKKPPKGSLL